MKATICKYFLYTILGASLSYNAYATSPKKPTPEQKGLATINQESAKAQVGFLASDELEGREAGWKRPYCRKLYRFSSATDGHEAFIQ